MSAGQLENSKKSRDAGPPCSCIFCTHQKNNELIVPGRRTLQPDSVQCYFDTEDMTACMRLTWHQLSLVFVRAGRHCQGESGGTGSGKARTRRC